MRSNEASAVTDPAHPRASDGPAHAADLAAVRGALRGAQRGDLDATSALLEHLRCDPNALLGILGRSSARLSGEEAEDVSQEVFLAVWSRLDAFDGRHSLEAWIRDCSRRQAVRSLRSRARPRRVELGCEWDALPAVEEDVAAREEQRALVLEALERLDPRSARVVRLKHYRDLKFREISQVLGARESTVKARYYRALAVLRTRLASRAGTFARGTRAEPAPSTSG